MRRKVRAEEERTVSDEFGGLGAGAQSSKLRIQGNVLVTKERLLQA